MVRRCRRASTRQEATPLRVAAGTKSATSGVAPFLHRGGSPADRPQRGFLGTRLAAFASSILSSRPARTVPWLGAAAEGGMIRPVPPWWVQRMISITAVARRVVDPSRISDAELEDIRARDLLEADAPPLSGRAMERAWRQAHADRAALLAEVDALRGPPSGNDADGCAGQAPAESTMAAFAKG